MVEWGCAGGMAVLDLNEEPRRSPVRMLLAVLALAGVALLGARAFDATPAPVRERLGFVPLPTRTLSPAEATEQALAAPTDSPTLTPTAEYTPTPVPVREDHYWLARPIRPDGNNRVEYTYPYGSRGDGSMHVHRGVEFVNPAGTPILAMAAGRVVFAGDDSVQVSGARENYYGLVVIVELERRLDQWPVFVVCAHMSEVAVAAGDRVETGQVIGYVGMTGIALGPHVHVEVRVGRNDFHATANPELWLTPLPGEGAVAGVVLGSDGQPVAEVDLAVRRASEPAVNVRERATYPALEVNADPWWGENFCFADLAPGDWILVATRSGYQITMPFTVEAGRTTWVTMPVPW